MKQRESIHVAGSPTRCPYCHDEVDPAAQAWVACSGCLARHHEGCWLGACASCSHGQSLAPNPEQQASSSRRCTRALRQSPAQLSVERAFREGAAFYRRPGFGLVLLAAVITSLLSGASLLILGGLLSAGLWTVFLKRSGHEQAKLSDLFTHTDRFGALTGAYLFAALLGLVGLALGGVGCVPVIALLTYQIPLISEQGLSFGESLRESARRAREGGLGKHLWLGLLTLLLLLPEIAASAVVPGLGVLVGALLVPLTFGIWVSAYRQVVEEVDPVDSPRSVAEKCDSSGCPAD